MSRHKTHKVVDRLLLGREYPKVHIYLDEPAWLWGLGRRHRIARHHPVATPVEVLLQQYLRGEQVDTGAALSAFLHILTDRVDSFVGLTQTMESFEKIKQLIQLSRLLQLQSSR